MTVIKPILFAAFFVSFFSLGQSSKKEKIAEHFLYLDSLTADSVLSYQFNPFSINSNSNYYFFKSNLESEFEFTRLPKLSTNYFTLSHSTDSVLFGKFKKSSFFLDNKFIRFDGAYMYRYTYKIELLEKTLVISIINPQNDQTIFYCRFNYINESEIPIPRDLNYKTLEEY